MIPENTSDFHVVLFDIDGDGNPTAPRVGGYFSPEDFNLKSIDGLSNEALVIYVDSRHLGYTSGSTWSPTDWSPLQALDVASHEFQHMIYEYQMRIKAPGRGLDNSTNELLSAMITDILADEMGWTAIAPRADYVSRWTSNPDKSMISDWNSNSTAAYEAAYMMGSMLFRNIQLPCVWNGNVCDMTTANGFRSIYSSRIDGIGALEKVFSADGTRGLSEWSRLLGVSLATGASSSPDFSPGADRLPAWSIAGRNMSAIRLWQDYNAAPTILASLPQVLKPLASYPVAVSVPANGNLSLPVPPNTWVTLLPNY